MALPREQRYRFCWGDHDQATTTGKLHYGYWVHDNERCRMVAALEGHPTLFLNEAGSNVEARCKACQQLLMYPPKLGD